MFDDVYVEETPLIAEQRAASPRTWAASPTPEPLRRAALMPTMTMAKALNEGLRTAMESDPKVVVMGEDVGKLGGVFRVTDGCRRTSARTG
jgi:hypothetical protein